MKTKLVKDIPIGVFMIVLSLWCVFAVQTLAGWPELPNLIGILLMSVLGWKLILVGMDVIIGIEIKDDK